MDRAIVYPQEQAADTDILNISKFGMVGLGWLIQAVLGTGFFVDGLACTPGTGLNVSVAAGACYSGPTATDATGFGSLGTDAHLLMKQGLSLDPVTLAVPAPGGAGQSINYLVQVAYSDTDAGSTVLSYYNSANPLVPYSGPGNSGNAQVTLRKGICNVSVKAGTAAATGSQTTPSPDAGYTGLYVVTIANGASSVVTGNISQLATAPFIAVKLPTVAANVQSGKWTYAADTGSANAMVATLSPAPASLTAGLAVMIKAAANNTGATTLNLNGLGAVSIKISGANLSNGMIVAGQIYELVYDGTAWEMISPPSAATVPAGASMTFSGSSAPTGWLVEDGSSLSTTTYAALFAAIGYSYGGSGASFNIPDSRGLFDRAYDSGGAVDPGRSLYTVQGHAVQSHNHSNGVNVTTGSAVPFSYGDTSTGVVGSTTAHTDANSAVRNGYTSSGTVAPGAGSGSAVGTFASETRPSNLARIRCIKF